MPNDKNNFKINKVLTLFFITLLTFLFLSIPQVLAKNTFIKKQTEILNTNTLSLIDNYQKNYFTIIKRNNVLLNWEDNKALNKDKKELNRLYRKLKKQITNKKYMKEYKEIKKHYSKCNEITTIGISEFAQKNYNEVDNLLNMIYEEIKSKTSPEDFKKIALSEAKWLKDIEDYENVYNSMDFGTMGGITYYSYKTNMKEFRALLLMLYL